MEALAALAALPVALALAILWPAARQIESLRGGFLCAKDRAALALVCRGSARWFGPFARLKPRLPRLPRVTPAAWASRARRTLEHFGVTLE